MSLGEGALAVLGVVLAANVLSFLRAQGKYRRAQRGLEELVADTLGARAEEELRLEEEARVLRGDE